MCFWFIVKIASSMLQLLD
uniref:Uncharacterized protein n=1 Tax=Anguilla anguilla TaxID=7936 RepID=A0A0E9VGG4_ANGAN